MPFHNPTETRESLSSVEARRCDMIDFDIKNKKLIRTCPPHETVDSVPVASMECWPIGMLALAKH